MPACFCLLLLASACAAVRWGGEPYAVRDERVRIALHAAQELQEELDAGGAGALGGWLAGWVGLGQLDAAGAGCRWGWDYG